MSYFLALACLVAVAHTAPLSHQEILERLARGKNGFRDGDSVGRVSAVREASGLAASRRHPGYLYTLNDSGDRARLYVIEAKNGEKKATIEIRGAKNKDWEDLAVGPCGKSGKWHCIYIADVGGNTGDAENIIYKVKEPPSIRSRDLGVDSYFKFDWDEDNSESVMVDEEGVVYLIPKISSGREPKLYKLPTDGWGSSSRKKIRSIATIPIKSDKRGPTAADISPNGQEILVKTYEDIYYWKRRSGEDVEDALERRPEEVPCEKERQGETVCWSHNADGYYTLSEGSNQKLFYYKKD